MSARRLTLRALVLFCALAAVSPLGGATAQATVAHKYLFQFSKIPASSGAPLPGVLTAAHSMTIDSGHVWISEFIEGTASFRVDKFDAATGEFISQFAHSFGDPEYFSIAIGHLTGEPEPQVYLSEYHEEAPRLGVYSESGAKQATWTGAETPTKSWGGLLTDVDVDNSASLADSAAGDVYVADPEHKVVDVFSPQAGGKEKYLTQLAGTSPTEPFVHPEQVAVNEANGDVVVSDSAGAGDVVDVFEPVAALPGVYKFLFKITADPSGPLRPVSSLAVDGNGDIYVDQSQGHVIDQFSAAGAYLSHMTGTPVGPFEQGPVGVATDPTSNDVYVGDKEPEAEKAEGGFVDVFGPSIVIPDVTTEAASSLKAKSATLNGMVNPDGAGAATCQFDYGTTTSFGQIAPCSEQVANGEGAVAVHAAVPALTPDTTYYYSLQASNANGTNVGEAVQDQELTTPGPGIHQESASVVTSTSVTLNATIDPHNASTSYYFQYGTSASYGANVPAPPGVDIGSAAGDLSVSVHLQGLTAGATYHFRVVATSEPGGEPVTAEGADQTFQTQAAGSASALPDGRSWEVVTPLNKQGAGLLEVGNEQGADIQAADGGGAITYAATGPFVVNPQGSRSIEVTQVISTRSAPGSWETQDITTPHTEGVTEISVGHANEYKLFSSDLSLGLVEPAGHTPLPPLPPSAEKTIYLRAANGEYKALVTSANVPAGTKFGGNGEGAGGVEYVTGTPDLSHVVLRSVGVELTKGGATGGLYEWADGQLQPASVLPDGTFDDGTLGLSDDVVRHAISNDGSRLVWSSGNTDYLRDMTRKETIQLNNGSSLFRTASSDDSRVFFTSAERLTATSTAGAGLEDLYEFELTSGPSEPLAGKVTDLTVDANAKERANVLGVIGASEDGSFVYFVANGVLGGGLEHGAKSGDCERGEQSLLSARCNLYMERYDDGTKTWMPPTFIAALSGADNRSWDGGNGGEKADLKGMTSRVSPNGRYLSFMSERSLTGYENRDANSGVPDEEVFLYDASTGRLVCPSCNPTGARPVGLFELSGFQEHLVDYAGNWNNRWFAANIPGWDSLNLSNALYQTRYLSSSGRLFFNSSDALVPADVNGKEDVYQYEPAGLGSCQGAGHGQSASVVYSESSGGCVGLISAGTSTDESAFLDASESGGDVFFLTDSRLVASDVDTSVDLYDAHECTASAPCAPPVALAPPPCTTGDACKPAPTPQPTLFGAPSSATFSGAGNITPSSQAVVAPKPATSAQKLAKALRACKKRPMRERASCKTRARKRDGAKSSHARKSLSTRTGR